MFVIHCSPSTDTIQARLVETGTKKLCQLYTTIVAEGSVGPAPVVGAELESVSLKSKFYDQLVPVVAFLRTLPLPATHPSHPAAAYILTTFKEAQKGFADMRGNWCVKCLEISGKRVLDRAETIDPVLAGDEFGKWVGGLLSASESEYNLLLDLSLMANPPALASSYTALLNPILTLFSKTLTSLIAFIKRSLHKYTFLALSSYEHMLLMQERWDDVLSLRGSNKESNEFREGITTLRSLCMRSFPEFLVDLKVAAIPKPNADLNTGLADFVLSVSYALHTVRLLISHQTVRYMERIPEVQVAAANALLTLGDGNWKMGEGVPLANKQKLREGDEAIIMEHYTCTPPLISLTFSKTSSSRRSNNSHQHHQHSLPNVQTRPSIRFNIPNQQHLLPPQKYPLRTQERKPSLTPLPPNSRRNQLQLPNSQSSLHGR